MDACGQQLAAIRDMAIDNAAALAYGIYQRRAERDASAEAIPEWKDLDSQTRSMWREIARSLLAAQSQMLSTMLRAGY